MDPFVEFLLVILLTKLVNALLDWLWAALCRPPHRWPPQ